MPSVSPIKCSPIAKYLTENKAITKREGKNLWRFYSPEGLYLGRQIKIETPVSNTYIREIYGGEFKKLFHECKVIVDQCAYYKNLKSPIGLSIAVLKSFSQLISVDFIKSKMTTVSIEKNLCSPKKVIGVERNLKVAIYDIEKPILYDYNKTLEKTEDLRPRYRINHMLN